MPVLPISAPGVGLDDRGGLVVAWQADRGSLTRGVVVARLGSAASGFGAEQQLSHGAEDASNMKLAADAAGDAVAVWSEDRAYQNGMDVGLMPFGVWASVRPAGGRFGGPVRLLAPGIDHTAPTVGIDARGDAAAAFVAGGVAYVASRPAGGVFGPLVPVMAGRYALGNDAPYSQLLMAPSGAALLLSQSDAVASQVQIRPAGGSFGAPQSIPSGARVAVGARGDALVATGTVHRVVSLSYGPPGGRLGSPMRIADSADPMAVALDGLGQGLIVIDQGPGASPHVEAATSTPSGGVGAFSPVAPSVNGIDLGGSLAVNDAGRAIFAWERDAPVTGQPPFFMPATPEVAFGSTTGGLGSAQALLDPETQALNSASPAVAINNQATAAVVWEDARRYANANPPLPAASETLFARTYTASGSSRTFVVTSSSTPQRLLFTSPYPPAATIDTGAVRSTPHGLLPLPMSCGADDKKRCITRIVVRLRDRGRAITIATRQLRLRAYYQALFPRFTFVRLTRQALAVLRARGTLRAVADVITRNPHGAPTAIETPLTIKR